MAMDSAVVAHLEAAVTRATNWLEQFPVEQISKGSPIRDLQDAYMFAFSCSMAVEYQIGGATQMPADLNGWSGNQ